MIRSALLLPLALLAACADTPIRTSTASFDWLTGCWRVEREGGHYDEVWLPPTADGTLGVAREVQNGRAVSHEYMRLELRPDQSIALIVQPSGQALTEFRMAEHAPGKLAFENDKNDFPSRIEYRYVDLNAIHARIEGTRSGRAAAVDFPLQRVECEG